MKKRRAEIAAREVWRLVNHVALLASAYERAFADRDITPSERSVLKELSDVMDRYLRRVPADQYKKALALALFEPVYEVAAKFSTTKITNSALLGKLRTQVHCRPAFDHLSDDEIMQLLPDRALIKEKRGPKQAAAYLVGRFTGLSDSTVLTLLGKKTSRATREPVREDTDYFVSISMNLFFLRERDARTTLRRIVVMWEKQNIEMPLMLIGARELPPGHFAMRKLALGDRLKMR